MYCALGQDNRSC